MKNCPPWSQKSRNSWVRRLDSKEFWQASSCSIYVLRWLDCYHAHNASHHIIHIIQIIQIMDTSHYHSWCFARTMRCSHDDCPRFLSSSASVTGKSIFLSFLSSLPPFQILLTSSSIIIIIIIIIIIVIIIITIIIMWNDRFEESWYWEGQECQYVLFYQGRPEGLRRHGYQPR